MGEAPIDELDGFWSLGAGVRIPWNTPFRAAREALADRQHVRQIEEMGLRTIRFEDTLRGATPDEMVDLQNELYFNPDFGYALRSASIVIEGIGGRSHLKQEGSYRPLVEAYLRLYRLLRDRHGAPMLENGVRLDDPDALVRQLDHTRESTLVIAAWTGARTHLSHELHVAFSPRHVLRCSAASSRLVLRNETGRDGLVADVVFPGGHAEAALPAGAEREIEVPSHTDAEVRVRLAGRGAESKVSIPGPGSRRIVGIRRRFWGGALSIHASPA